MRASVVRVLTTMIMLLSSAAAARAELFTIFTGIQDGVDLRAPPAPPPEPLPPGSIVNTSHAPFTLGAAPFTATFGGEGFAFHVGIPGTYAFADGGRNFWGVRGDGLGSHTGVIAFSTPASFVSLLARGTPDGIVSPPPFLGPIGEAQGVIRAFGPGGSLIGEVTLQNDLPIAGIPIDRSNMQLIEFAGPVERIELVNSGAANSFALISLLEAQPVPEPSTLALVSAGLAAAAGYTWRRRRTAA